MWLQLQRVWRLSNAVVWQLPLRLGLPKIMPGLTDNASTGSSQAKQSGTSSIADLSAAAFTSLPRIPCASVLVRVQVQTLPSSPGPSPAAVSSARAQSAASVPLPSAPLTAPFVEFLDTRALEAAIAPPPSYSDGSYDSTAATPAGSEVSMYAFFISASSGVILMSAPRPAVALFSWFAGTTFGVWQLTRISV